VPEFRSEETKIFYDYWMSLDAGRMPHYREWDPIRVAKQMPWCTIVERGGETGYRLRFAGTAICEFYNEEMTGQEVGHRMTAEARAFYFAQIEETLTRPCGIFFGTHARSDSGRDCLFDTLALPFADDTGAGCRLITHQSNIEEVTYGEARTRFSMPQVAEWIDLGEGVPPRVDLASVHSSSEKASRTSSENSSGSSIAAK
jgi:hypothetical protein